LKFASRHFEPKLSRFFHADLEELERIRQAYRKRPTAELASRFSTLLRDLSIGGFSKHTGAGRLHLSEAVLARQLVERTPRSARILDLGASDGVTTYDLVQTLKKAGWQDFRVDLVDLHLRLARYRKSAWLEYRTPSGVPVFLRLGRLVWRLPRADHRWDFVSWILISRLLRSPSFQSSFRKAGTISLVNPSAEACPEIHVHERSCLEHYPEWDGQFDAVRACNLLNKSYFDDEALVRIISLLKKYLKPEGLLLVSRNPEEEERSENGTLFTKRGGELVVLERIGTGSEIEPLCGRLAGGSRQLLRSSAEL
jgi:chemotaxis methyl-accepting protein methylase